MLTIKQEKHPEDVSIQCLLMLHPNVVEFVTIDDRWDHRFTPETNEQSKQWSIWGGIVSRFSSFGLFPLSNL